MIILETSRLILRRFQSDDLDSLYALYCDTEVVRFIPDAPRTYEETRDELEWFMNGHPKNPDLGLWATVYKPTGIFIGRCGLLSWTIDGQAEVEVAYLIAKEYWGQGLGTEIAQAITGYAIEKLQLSRLVCLIDGENLASIKVARKIGMSFEKEGLDDKGPFMMYSLNRLPVSG